MQCCTTLRIINIHYDRFSAMVPHERTFLNSELARLAMKRSFQVDHQLEKSMIQQGLSQIVYDLLMIVKKQLVLEMIVDGSLEMIEDESLEMIIDETLKLDDEFF
ncbi:hypothetical protein Tco_0653772 [Tanacetum coccineum]|uniref:Uncharacterized protein n=1 Tax=Tanacetum coccineum TaxID=301880 RepID=A0ABQ4X1R9_9ASTR